MKKILIFSLAYYPKHIGGAEIAVKEITDRIAPDEYEFHMVTNRYDSTLQKTEQIGNVLVHRIGIARKNPSMADLRKLPLHLNKLLYQFLAYFTAKKLHKEHHYDAVWAIMAHATGVPAGRFKKVFPDVKYILTLQEGDEPKSIVRKMRIFGGAFKRAFRSADIVQSISHFLQNWSRRMGFEGASVVIPNAVDTKHFTQEYSEEVLKSTKEVFGKHEGDTFLVTTSRLVHKNGIDTVIRAMALLLSNTHFVIYGSGPDEEKLKKLTKELHVEKQVHFMGHIDHEDMPRHLKACDVFIRPSRSEGMGNSFIEAMAAGLPVIATQEGGIADFLFDAEKNPGKEPTGFAVPVDDPAAIRDAVLRIISEPENTKATVECAKQMVIEKYDWETIAANMKERVFDAVLRA